MRRMIVRRFPRNRSQIPVVKTQQSGIKLSNSEMMKKFGPSMLDLGDFGSPSQEMEAVSAIFDLSGFTQFCNQVDAYLAIPRFLNEFLTWLFSKIKIGLTESFYERPRSYWVELPILTKFLGDGILLVWNARQMTEANICNIIPVLYDICYDYRHQFYPRISTAVVKPPVVLRCGIARGKVFSVGDGKDYVGHCVNTASRLSHLSVVSFCFPHRGFQVQEYMPEEYYRLFVKKYLSVRGVGKDELVWIVKEEFDKLPEPSKRLFRSCS
jgi:class 3 adenylate cyclase